MVYLYCLHTPKDMKLYVGVSNNPDKRLKEHKYQASKGRKTKLYDFMRKHGLETFEIEIIESFGNRKDAYKAECHLIEDCRYNNIELLNLANGGEGGFVVQDKEQWKQKLSKARQGRKPALGMKHSEENKKIFSECGKKRWEGKTYPTDVLHHSFKDASKLFGISKTHYYRLLKQAKINDLG